MEKHNASCSCGQLTLTYEGEINKSSVCHCFACQKRTGSAFGYQTRVTKNSVLIAGPTKKYKRIGDAGGQIEFNFCPNCGSTVFWEIDSIPNSYIVALGAFANKNLPSPTFSVYEDRKQQWVNIPGDTVEHHN